jgi:hypothetical protein
MDEPLISDDSSGFHKDSWSPLDPVSTHCHSYLEQLFADTNGLPRLWPPEDLLAQVRDALVRLTSTAPFPRRLEMGCVAKHRLMEHLRALGAIDPARELPGELPGLYGIPITPGHDIAPHDWRLIGDDDQIMKEGTL